MNNQPIQCHFEFRQVPAVVSVTQRDDGDKTVQFGLMDYMTGTFIEYQGGVMVAWDRNGVTFTDESAEARPCESYNHGEFHVLKKASLFEQYVESFGLVIDPSVQVGDNADSTQETVS